MSQIEPDDFLFLYNTTSSFEISGPYLSTSQPAKNIEKGAWLGKFPVQIKFEATEQTKTIPFTKIQHIIKKFRNDIYPWPEVSEEQTKEIIEIFEKEYP